MDKNHRTRAASATDNTPPGDTARRRGNDEPPDGESGVAFDTDLYRSLFNKYEDMVIILGDNGDGVTILLDANDAARAAFSIGDSSRGLPIDGVLETGAGRDLLSLIRDTLPDGAPGGKRCSFSLDGDDASVSPKVFTCTFTPIGSSTVIVCRSVQNDLHDDDIRYLLSDELEKRIEERTRRLSRKVREQDRRQSDLRFQAMLLDKIEDVITATDLDGRITYVNDTGARLLGRSRDEIVGMSVTELGDNPERGATQGEILEAMKQHGRWEGRVANRTADGRERLLESRIWMFHSSEGEPMGMVSISTDITDREKAYSDLIQSTTQLELALEGADMAPWSFDPAAGTFDRDERFSAMLGHPEATAQCAAYDGWLGAIHPDDRDIVAKTFEDHSTGRLPRFDVEYRIMKESGDYLWVLDRGRAVQFDSDSKPRRIAGTTINITVRKKVEEEHRQLESQIQQAQKLESLGVLAGGIAHDFNNLLMGILGNADLALMDLSPVSPARESIEDIVRSAQRASELSRQMLAYSGKGRFVITSIDMSELVIEMEHLLEASISKKALLKYNLAQHLPLVDADVNELRQVVMNLVSNASEAIGERSGIISITTGIMECDTTYLARTWLNEELQSGVYVYLEVADNGCGMDPSVMRNIFDPFFTTKFTGRGLGLAAVLGIVRGHRGAIKVYSEPGSGTTFKILLPASDQNAATQHGESDAADEWQGSGVVLLADDEETVRRVGRRMLERMGFNVIIAQDGREALDLFRQHHDEIQCVLLDLTMPHLSGEEVYRELRRVRENIRVVICSGYNELEIVNRFAGKGLAGFIQKPYQYSRLEEIIRTAVGDMDTAPDD